LFRDLWTCQGTFGSTRATARLAILHALGVLPFAATTTSTRDVSPPPRTNAQADKAPVYRPPSCEPIRMYRGLVFDTTSCRPSVSKMATLRLNRPDALYSQLRASSFR
jgi:hypothetical protein